MDEKTAVTYAIVRALAYKENGGKPNLDKLKAGQSGELKSIFQFEPGTWEHDAAEYLGDPKAPLTPDNETQVMVHKVGKYVDEGKTVEQIASMHNAGIGEPDAYTGKFSSGKASVGVNKYGVKFDVPKYASDVADLAKHFYKTELGQQQGQPDEAAPTAPTPSAPPTAPQAPKPSAPSVPPSGQQGLLGKLMLTPLGAQSPFSV